MNRIRWLVVVVVVFVVFMLVVVVFMLVVVVFMLVVVVVPDPVFLVFPRSLSFLPFLCSLFVNFLALSSPFSFSFASPFSFAYPLCSLQAHVACASFTERPAMSCAAL